MGGFDHKAVKLAVACRVDVTVFGKGYRCQEVIGYCAAGKTKADIERNTRMRSTALTSGS